MATPLAAALLVAVLCAPCALGAPASDADLFSLLSGGLETLSTVARDLQDVRLNDTGVDVTHSLEFLLQQATAAVTYVATHLPDLVNPFKFVGEMFPYVVAVALAALPFLPGLVVPAKMAALFLSVLSLHDQNWKLFDSYYLKNI